MPKATEKKDPKDMTVKDLIAELKTKGLPTTGRKAELLARLLGTETKAETKRPREEEDDGEEDDKKEPQKEKEKEKENAKSDSTSQPRRKAARLQEKLQKEEKKEAEKKGDWEEEGSVFIWNPFGLKHSDHIIGFDFDDTLTETKSGKKAFNSSRTDWQWLYDTVPAKLKEIYSQNVKICVFTNQSGIAGSKGFDPSKAATIKGKLCDAISELDFPVQIFVATSDDQYRKPATAMWDLMTSQYNGGIKPDLAKCAYVGDAAGRPAGWKEGKKKDFANTDRKFAGNVGVKFQTPEEFFLGEPAADFKDDSFDTSSLPINGTDITDGGVEKLASSQQEMIIFVGFPASGKSTLAKKYLVPKGYVHVNRDTMGTQAKCLKATREGLTSLKSVVIDNTNPSSDTRADYIALAAEFSVPVRCFRFEITEDLAKHLNYYRERLTNGEIHHVPRIGYAVYKKKLEEPQLREGFTEIRKIHFVPHFNSEEEKKLFEIAA